MAPKLPGRNDPPEPWENFGHIPARFREDYDPEPYTDPNGIEHPINPRDVLDPAEYAAWLRSRR